MWSIREVQIIEQLEKKKGGYAYITISSEKVKKHGIQKQTRLLCTVDQKLQIQCGLNHLGDGNYFIILGAKNLKALNKKCGDKIQFELVEDPNPLGISFPETLQVLLDQDDELRRLFEKMSPGKKRSIIHAMNRFKSIDKQVQTATTLISENIHPSRRRVK